MVYAEILQSAFAAGAPTAGPGIVARTPMVLTSRLRTSTDPVINRQRDTYFKVQPGGWLLSSIEMAVNPNSVRVEQGKRITKKDTLEGSTYFHFGNEAGENNDIATMSFTGSTGNIDLRGSLTQPGNGPDTGALRKLQVWQNLYLLTREPMLLADGRDNVFIISYASALFPVPMNLYGFFSQVLSYDETGQKPNSRTYTFEFTVTSVDPPLSELAATMSVAAGTGAVVIQPTATITLPANVGLGSIA
jgi:hypothetical protein